MIVIAVLYLPVVFGIKYVVDGLPKETRDYLRNVLEPYNASWDLSLCIFSLLGSYYTISHLINHGYDCTFIEYPQTVKWLNLFCQSKSFELLDTVFVVLRSRRLVLLQYYHHLATLIAVQAGTMFYPRELLLFGAMNYSVHVFMYGYYFLCSQGFKGLRRYGYVVTILQTLQMVVAVHELIVRPGVSCTNPEYYNPMVYYGAFVMYFSYLVLFGKLLVEKIRQRPTPSEDVFAKSDAVEAVLERRALQERPLIVGKITEDVFTNTTGESSTVVCVEQDVFEKIKTSIEDMTSQERPLTVEEFEGLRTFIEDTISQAQSTETMERELDVDEDVFEDGERENAVLESDRTAVDVTVVLTDDRGLSAPNPSPTEDTPNPSMIEDMDGSGIDLMSVSDVFTVGSPSVFSESPDFRSPIKDKAD